MPDNKERLGNRIRVRSGALLLSPDAQSLLLIEHDGIWEPEPFWTPPGGGVAFGESLEEGLIRETREGTGLDIRVGPLRYIVEFIRPPLHAVSFYYSGNVLGGTLRTGFDPEFSREDQLIRTAAFIPLSHLSSIRIYPEAFRIRLENDIRSGFPDSPCFLGTFR